MVSPGAGIRGAPNYKSHAMTSSKIFERGTFMGLRYLKMKGQKSWIGLALKQDCAKRRKL